MLVSYLFHFYYKQTHIYLCANFLLLIGDYLIFFWNIQLFFQFIYFHRMTVLLQEKLFGQNDPFEHALWTWEPMLEEIEESRTKELRQVTDRLREGILKLLQMLLNPPQFLKMVSHVKVMSRKIKHPPYQSA